MPKKDPKTEEEEEDDGEETSQKTRQDTTSQIRSRAYLFESIKCTLSAFGKEKHAT